MTQNKNCPECGNMLTTKAKKCRCGWKEFTPSNNNKILDPRCNYRVAGHRCPKFGTISPGRNGEWFCSDHWQLENIK